MKTGITYLILGGTGSLGKTLVRRLLAGDQGMPNKIIVFSRDEAKQHFMRLEYRGKKVGTDDIAYQDSDDLLEFQIGDARDYAAVAAAVARADVVIYAAALKHVPSCEYVPLEAVKTNVLGAANVVRAVQEVGHNVKVVLGVSTDKACKPINAMGITKALQERVFVAANLHSDVPHICVRYGNVLASRGSVLPLFAQQVQKGGPVTITDKAMTRFLLSLDDAVDTIFHALANPVPGAIFVPQVPSASMEDVARYMIGDTEASIEYTGIRPGEKLHEILISEEEGPRTYSSGEYYAVLPMLPELAGKVKVKPEPFGSEFNSRDHVMTTLVLERFLRERGVSVRELLAEEEPLR